VGAKRKKKIETNVKLVGAAGLIASQFAWVNTKEGTDYWFGVFTRLLEIAEGKLK